MGHSCTTSAPEFFRKNKNQFPSSAKDTPFQLGLGTELSYFDWLGQNPELAKDFQQWMTLKQQATPNWVDWFDLQGTILKDFRRGSADNILLVDVGGGEGHYLNALNQRFADLPGRLVLQDLPQVISSIEDRPQRTELMAHDFFTSQPVKGMFIVDRSRLLQFDWSRSPTAKSLGELTIALRYRCTSILYALDSARLA